MPRTNNGSASSTGGDYVDTIVEPLNTKIQHITATPFATYFTNDVVFRSAAEIVIEPDEGLFLASDIVTLTGNQVRVLGDITISNALTTTKTLFLSDQEMVTKAYVDSLVYANTKLRYPKTPLTDGSRVTSSPSMGNDSFQPFRAFDGIYGENAIEVYSNPQNGGWFSSSDDTTSSLMVNGINTIGRYVYLDIATDSTTAIIKSFQIYSMRERFPIEYHLIGSNDQSNWTSLYHTTSAVSAGSIPHGDYNTGYTHEINLTNNYTFYRYVGLIVQSQSTLIAFPANHTSIQELLLFSTR